MGKTYYSFDDIAVEEFGMKPLNRRTNDKQKLEAQREKFEGTCPYCKQRAKFVVGTNVVVCANPKCNGKKIVVKGEPDTDLQDTVMYRPFARMLSDNAAMIGNTIFDE